MPGSDYHFTLPRGIFNSQLTARSGSVPATYGIDPAHFCVEARFSAFLQAADFKLGRFNMIHGVEMNEAPMNMLASHNYTYPADPFTHTGLLATPWLYPPCLSPRADRERCRHHKWLSPLTGIGAF